MSENITFADLYENPTIKMLAEKIENEDKTKSLLLNLKTFNNKSDSLVFAFRKNSTNEFIELAPSYNNELILQDFKKGILK